MNVILWILQVLLALHTIMGAIWKFSNPAEKAIPSLKAIPPAVWISLCIVEFVLSLGLLLPAFDKSLGILAPIAAACIAVEMLFFCGVHLASREPDRSPLVYWGVVAVVCTFIAYGRFVLAPF